MQKIGKIISTIEKGVNVVDKGSDLIMQIGTLAGLVLKVVSEIVNHINDKEEK